MLRQLARTAPTHAQAALQNFLHLPRDMARLLDRENMVPPRFLSFVGDGDFEQVGQEFARHFVNLAGLQPDERVLDVGCGIGRMAIPLTGYLSAEGEYWGMDVVERGVSWCRKRISPRFDNFHFLHSDVYNRHYHRKGRVPAQEYRFPFDDGYFDFVFLISVFTHMLPMDMENYLAEVARVLRPGGRCLMTFFLLNREAQELISAGRSAINFQHEVDGCLVAVKHDAEAAIAFLEDTVVTLCQERGLCIEKPIHYGSWCGRRAYMSFQDMVIGTKRSTPDGHDFQFVPGEV